MSLLCWWPLNGDLHNQGLNNSADGTFSGTASYPAGKIGKCVECKSSSYVVLPYTCETTSNYTIAMWIKIPTAMNSATAWEQAFIYSNTGGGGASWASYHNLKIYDDSNHQYQWLAPGTTFNYDQWFHLTLVHKDNNGGNTTQFYINGSLYATNNSTSALQIKSGNFVLGAGISTSIFFNDLRIYSHALSPKEVSELAKGLVLHYKLDQSYNLLTDTTNTWTNIELGQWYSQIISIPMSELTNKGLVNGQYITYSCDVKAASGQKNLYLRLQHYNSGDDRPNNYSSVVTAGQSGRLSITTQLNTSYAYLQLLLGNASSSSTTTTEQWKCIKLEAGNVPTPWEPIHDQTIMWDSSGYGYNGTIVGNLSINALSPRYNCSTKFSSTTIQLAPIFLDNTNQCHTVSAWVYPTSTNNSTLINFNAGYYLFYGNGGRTLMYLNSDKNDSYVYGTVLPINTWTLITWVLDTSNQTCKVYYNGELNASASNYTSSDIPVGINKTLVIGSGFSGYISDFRIYATALSAAAVKDLYETSGSVDNMGNVFAREVIE